MPDSTTSSIGFMRRILGHEFYKNDHIALMEKVNKKKYDLEAMEQQFVSVRAPSAKLLPPSLLISGPELMLKSLTRVPPKVAS